MLSSMRLCSNVPAQSIVQTALGGYQSVNEYIQPGGRIYEQRDYVYKALTDIPGISECFDRGLVTYSNEAKTSELDVKPETLEKYGAISAETAEEMVRGLSLYSGCSCCISVTGLAGPEGDEGKPVGLFYVGLLYNGKLSVKEFRSRRRTREDIRNFAVTQMTRMIYEAIK